MTFVMSSARLIAMTTPLNRRSDWSAICAEAEATSAAAVSRRLGIPASSLRSALGAFAAQDEGGIDDEPGFVYALSNPSFSQTVLKIGRSYDLPEVRAGQLWTTGVPTPFEVELSLFTSASHTCERAVHEALQGLRVSETREFFRVAPHQLRRLFSLLDEGAPPVEEKS